MPLDLARCRSIPLDLPPSGNTAMPVIGRNYGGKGDSASMDIMSFASLAAILEWVGEANEHPSVSEAEFTPLDLVALGRVLMLRNQ
jgi:hypothetical protein